MGEVIFKGSYLNGTSDCKPPPALPITTTMVRSKAGRLHYETVLFRVKKSNHYSALHSWIICFHSGILGQNISSLFLKAMVKHFFNCFSCVGIRMFLDRYVRFVGLSKIAIALGEGYGHGVIVSSAIRLKLTRLVARKWNKRFNIGDEW